MESFVTVQVLDHGSVELYQHCASDLSVVNSARVSFNNRHNEIEDGDKQLINYLMKNHHGTPFEHNMMTFVVKAPIFVFREWHRHRIASINEMSARYTELPGEWYVPRFEHVRSRVGKPGHYTYELADEANAAGFITQLHELCNNSYVCYLHALDLGIAPEQARMLLHVNHYSQMFWTVNARSLMNFLNLRNSGFAQWEIRQYAEVIELFFEELMPITHAAFIDNGRFAP
jgi:thymidylate synthase (FAD)